LQAFKDHDSLTIMYDEDDDLTLLDTDADFSDESPLDQMESGEEEAAPPLDPDEMLPLLEDSDPSQRMLAARAFCELQDERAVPALIRLLEDVCPLVRVSAAYALGRNPHLNAVDPLINQLARDWNGYVRKGIVWALGNSRDRRSIPPLLKALATDISAVRLWAASALTHVGKLNYEDIIPAVPPIIEGLRQDSLAAVRSNCAWTLGQLCAELPSNVVYATAVDALIESYVEDEDFGVKEDAKASLLKLGDPRGLQLIEELEEEGYV
jgi:HEAT repeat protein